MQYSFSDDPGLSGRLFTMLDVVFPGIRRGAESMQSLGVSWESASTPFVHFENSMVVEPE